MLSFKTIIAIQLLRLIQNAGGKGLTVTDLKVLTGLQNVAVSQSILLLKKNNWVDCIRGNRYGITIRLGNKSLYDLVMLIDGKIQLACHVGLEHWGNGSHETMQEAMKINKGLHDSVKKMLQKVKLSDMIHNKVEHYNKAPMTQK